MSTRIESTIENGSLLIEEGTAVPPSFRLETAAYPAVWMSPGDNLSPQELESELTSSGWSFFYEAGAVRKTAFGFDQGKAVHAALEQLAAGAVLNNCNCLEIDEVAGHSFLGIPWVSVSAHSCRIQRGKWFQK
jgi:hypothetical protein